ncbi:MAG: LPS export ABC transporter periplasmic protein LptC [Ignavibacteriales bacterium]|nr:MAG: LPS export ABC transporter periplasmic protein LptC [Ignavibacteriales bacterium]
MVSVIILSLFISACSGERVKPVIDPNLVVEELPTQESWNSKVVFTDSGQTKAILHTGHLRVFSKSMETLLDDGVKVDFYNQMEKISTVLTSKRGRVDDATRDLYAIDSVVAVSDSGVTVSTEELMWRNKDRKIVSDKFVTIISPKEKIQGYGFESDQSLQNYVIYNITYVTSIDSTSQKSGQK